MEKISKDEAILMMSEVDFKVYKQELAHYINWSVENQKELYEDFYLDDGTLILYIGSEGLNLCPRIVFEGKKPVGRPAVGKTKRVALTLPEELWEKIEKDKEKEGSSLAAVLRDIIEDYYKEG